MNILVHAFSLWSDDYPTIELSQAHANDRYSITAIPSHNDDNDTMLVTVTTDDLTKHRETYPLFVNGLHHHVPLYHKTGMPCKSTRKGKLPVLPTNMFKDAYGKAIVFTDKLDVSYSVVKPGDVLLINRSLPSKQTVVVQATHPLDDCVSGINGRTSEGTIPTQPKSE